MVMPGTREQWWQGEVVAAVTETLHVRSLTLAVPGWPGHRSGEYVEVLSVDDNGLRSTRSYSIASSPEDNEIIQLTVEYVLDGEVSPQLVTRTNIDDRIDISQPYGREFSWDASCPDPRPLLLIAGGSGVVPMMAILRHRRRAGKQIEVPARLAYSARTADDIIYHREIDCLEASDDNLDVTVILTRDESATITEHHQRIDTALLREVGWLAAAKPNVFIAGPTRFVETAAGSLLELGYDPGWLHTEWFSPF